MDVRDISGQWTEQMDISALYFSASVGHLAAVQRPQRLCGHGGTAPS